MWNIRANSIEIARSFPVMTSLEFRRSLLPLIHQAEKNHTAIQTTTRLAAFSKMKDLLSRSE
jgi:hypothetical protein